MLRQFANSNWLKQIKQTLSLSDIQKQVLIGTVLGDGSLKISGSGKAARLQICHSASAKEYVLWKQKIFENWVFNEPTYYKINNSLIFRTVSHPLIFEYMKIFYRGRLKIIPKNICDLLKSPLSLAVWFMDDGNGYLKNSAFRISTYGFGLEGNMLLKNCLKKNFGLDVSVFRDSKGWQIYVPINNGSAQRFKFLICPYIISSMTYKIESRSPVET
ncbi:hypothetical protein HYU96_02470 [Candidatus Daviesbacteria bacterium]|nr:hypothetical protein [Candidatus Daviesbacteria bacterium]